MKRFALGLIATLVMVIGGASMASAYPPAPELTVSSQTPTAGSSITVTLQGCEPGATATFTLSSASSTATATEAGLATGTIAVPTAAGSYTLQAQCGDVVQSLPITVAAPTPTTQPTPGLPATGAGGLGSTVPMALALVLFGAMILGVAQLRRRANVTG